MRGVLASHAYAIASSDAASFEDCYRLKQIPGVFNDTTLFWQYAFTDL
jgi:hypothetical protein